MMIDLNFAQKRLEAMSCDIGADWILNISPKYVRVGFAITSKGRLVECAKLIDSFELEQMTSPEAAINGAIDCCFSEIIIETGYRKPEHKDNK